MDTGLRRYDASYYKPPLVMLGYDTPRQGDFFWDMRQEIWDRKTSLNNSLAKFARWANKEQIAKRKEQLNINYKTRHSREGGNPLRRRHFYAVPAGQ